MEIEEVDHLSEGLGAMEFDLKGVYQMEGSRAEKSDYQVKSLEAAKGDECSEALKSNFQELGQAKGLDTMKGVRAKARDDARAASAEENRIIMARIDEAERSCLADTARFENFEKRLAARRARLKGNSFAALSGG